MLWRNGSWEGADNEKSGKRSLECVDVLPNGMHLWPRNCHYWLPDHFPNRMPVRNHPALVVLDLAGWANRPHHLAENPQKERRNSVMFTFLVWGMIWRVLRRVFLIGLLLGAIAVLILFGFNFRTLIMLGVMLLGIRFILRAGRL